MLSQVMIKFYTKFHVPGNNDPYIIITTNWQPCTDLNPQIQTAIVLGLLIVRNKLYGDNITFNGIMFKPRSSKINLFALYRLMGDTRHMDEGQTYDVMQILHYNKNKRGGGGEQA